MCCSAEQGVGSLESVEENINVVFKLLYLVPFYSFPVVYPVMTVLNYVGCVYVVIIHTQKLPCVNHVLGKYLCSFMCKSGHFMDLNWLISNEPSGPGSF